MHPIPPPSRLLLDGARGDWVPPPGQAFKCSASTLAAFTHTLCVAYMAEIATAIGRPDDAARYSARLAANRKAYHAHFFNDGSDGARDGSHVDTASGHTNAAPRATRCCYGSGSQADNVFALFIGAVPPEHVNRTVAMLTTSINNHLATKPGEVSVGHALEGGDPVWGDGPHMDVGIFGTTYIFDVLHAYEEDALAIALLNQTTSVLLHLSN